MALSEASHGGHHGNANENGTAPPEFACAAPVSHSNATDTIQV